MRVENRAFPSLGCMLFCFVFLAVLAAPGPGAAAVPSKTKGTAGGAPSYGGVLTIAHSVDADQLGDPVARPFSSAGVRMAATSIETLLRYDEKGVPVPWLASGWKIAKDLRSITLTLRKGIKFHDGTEFNAQAAKWNLDRYRSSQNPELKAIQSIDVIDESTVRLNLSQWSSILLDNLTNYPGMMISPSAFQKNGAEWCRSHPVGTGPFKFVSWQRDVRIKFEKNPGYWQKGKPYLDGVEWVIITDMVSKLAAFKTGEVKAVTIVEPRDVREMEKDQAFYFSTGGLSAMLMCLVGDSGHASSPFADVRVRQAISHAVDRKALVEALTGNLGKVAHQYAAPGSWGANPQLKDYPFDPEKAKKLLAEAGYPNGFKTKIITPSWGLFATPPTAYQEYLRKVGITAEIEPVNQGRHQVLLRGGWQDALMVQQGTMVIPDAANNLAANASCRSFLKGTMECADDYESALTKALEAPNFDAKKKWTWEAQRLLVDRHALFNFFFTQPRISSFHSNVHDTGIGVTIDTQWTPENAWMSR